MSIEQPIHHADLRRTQLPGIAERPIEMDHTARLGSLVTHLVAHLDYDALVERAGIAAANPDPDPILGQTALLMDVRRTFQDGYDFPDEHVTKVAALFSSYPSTWAQAGLWRPQPHILPDSRQTARIHRETEDIINPLWKQLHKAGLIFNRYHHVSSGESEEVRKAAQTMKLLGRLLIGQGRQSESHTPSPLLAHSIAQYMQQRAAELSPHYMEQSTDSAYYQSFAYAARQLDGEQLARELTISGGLARMPFTPDEAGIEAFIATYMPPLSIKTVKEVVFRPFTEQEKEASITKDPAGRYTFTEDGQGVIVVSTEHIAKLIRDCRAANMPAAAITEAVQSHIEDVLTHEFTHALHSQLPACALLRWEAALSQNPTPVSPYASRIRKNGHNDAYGEQLADGASMLLVKPYDLGIVNLAALNGIQQLYADFHPRYNETVGARARRLVEEGKNMRRAARVTTEQYRTILLQQILNA